MGHRGDNLSGNAPIWRVGIMIGKEDWLAVTIVLLLVLVMTSGCAMFDKTVPVTMNFPQAPEPIMTEPEQLEPLPEDSKELSDLLQNSTVNYGKYRELQLKYLQWQRWYDTNRRLHKETTE